MCQFKPSLNIFHYIKSDRDPINPLDTAGVYRIKYKDENSKKDYYIGVTKQKIYERSKEHLSDIKNAKNNTAIARLALNENIKIDFNKTKKLSIYNNRTYGYYHETIEIKNNNTTYNDGEHPEWQCTIREKNMCTGREGK